MIKNVTNTFKANCKKDSIKYREYIVIDNKQVDIKGNLSDTAYKDTTFFGKFNLKMLKFETENDVTYKKKQFVYYKEVEGEAIRIGTFIVTDVSDSDTFESVNVTAYDFGLKFANPYETSLNYSSGNITLLQLVQEICTNCGVELESTTLPNGSFIIDSNQFVNDEQYGDVIAQTAGINGMFATINSNDKLEFIFTNETDEIIEDYVELEDKRDTQPITSVLVATSEDLETAGAVLKDEALIEQYGEHWLKIYSYGFAYSTKKCQSLVTAIFNQVKGFGYSSFKTEYSFLPYLSLGDKIKFRNKDGSLINSIILKYETNYNEVKLEAPSITDASVEYELPETPETIAKKAMIKVDQANGEIKLVVKSVEEVTEQVSETVKSVGKQYRIKGTTEWEDTQPTREVGQILEARDVYQHTDGTITYGTEYEITGDKGDTGAKGDTGQQGIQGEKGETGSQGPQGEKGATGDTGEQGYSVVASVSRTAFTESQWNNYGTTGHIENWSSTSSIRNDCRIGDIFTVVGTATDTGNSHTLWYRSTTASGDLKGTCINHAISKAGSKGDKGDKGDQGEQGIQGIQGVKGEDGTSTYFYVRYSANASGNPMTTTPNENTQYMGVVSTTSSTAPTSYTAYTWSKTKGNTGATGSAGATGANGKTSYLHIKYSEDGTSFTPAETGYALGEKPSAYIGQYVDFTETDSTTFDDYTWYKFTEDIDPLLDDMSNQIDDVNKNLNSNYYKKEEINNLILNSETGLTNIFKQIGGNNLLKNTALYHKTGNIYDYWTGSANKVSETRAVSNTAISLKNGTFKQSLSLTNTTYTISFKYEQKNTLATGSVKINGTSSSLSDSGEFKQIITIDSNQFEIEFTTDIDDSFIIYDLMLNIGAEQSPWSQSQNEVHTDTVNISKGISVEATENDTIANLGASGLNVTNKNTSAVVLKATDTGIETTDVKATIGTIGGLSVKKVGNQTWLVGV